MHCWDIKGGFKQPCGTEYDKLNSSSRGSLSRRCCCCLSVVVIYAVNRVPIVLRWYSLLSKYTRTVRSSCFCHFFFVLFVVFRCYMLLMRERYFIIIGLAIVARLLVVFFQFFFFFGAYCTVLIFIKSFIIIISSHHHHKSYNNFFTLSLDMEGKNGRQRIEHFHGQRTAAISFLGLLVHTVSCFRLKLHLVVERISFKVEQNLFIVLCQFHSFNEFPYFQDQSVAISICGLSMFTKIMSNLIWIKNLIMKVISGCVAGFTIFCTILPWPLLQIHKYIVIPVWETCHAQLTV